MNLIRPTKFDISRYKVNFLVSDFFYCADGDGEYPNHHCKLTFNTSEPFIKKFRNAIDIGCRDGEYTRYLMQKFEHTYCFDPRIMQRFADNVDLTKITHYACALGDANTEIVMSGGQHKISPLNWRNIYKTKLFKLDDFQITKVDYIKIDVEGYEHKVLVGAEQTILRDQPLIVLEKNHISLPGQDEFAAINWLIDRGYECVAKCPRGWDHVMIKAH